MTQVNIDYLYDMICKKNRADHSGNAAVHVELQRLLGRSVLRSYIEERALKIKGYQAQLEKLKATPVVEQRSPEWYTMRQGMMTASDLAQALGKGKFQTQKQFFVKKAGYDVEIFDPTIPPLKHGVMYESVANAFYEHLTGAKVLEFGLLRHPELPWFGASPDGITEEGIMLEIKVPWRRKITGEVPEQYYYQMQGQLDVAGLTECDFLECNIQEYPHQGAFLSDEGGEAGVNVNGDPIGVVLESFIDGNFVYEYSPWGLSATEAVVWAQGVCKENPKFTKTRFWFLANFSIVRVYKDDEFINKQLTLAAAIFDRVLHFRLNKNAYDLYLRGLGNIGVARVSKLPVTKKAATPHRPKQLDLSAYAFVDD